MSFGGDSPFDVLILSGESNSKYPQFLSQIGQAQKTSINIIG